MDELTFFIVKKDDNGDYRLFYKKGLEGPHTPLYVTGPVGTEIGDTGPTGPTGNQGPRGERGPRGNTGPTGPTGTNINILGYYSSFNQLQISRPSGQPGESYLVGSQIYTWENGWVNIGSIRGPQGATGPMGPTGPTGDTGLTGLTGPKGPPGQDNNTAGPQGPIGPQGDRGPQGSKGSQGSQGPQGEQGYQGNIGPKGARGPQYSQGIFNAHKTNLDNMRAGIVRRIKYGNPNWQDYR